MMTAFGYFILFVEMLILALPFIGVGLFIWWLVRR